MAYLVVLTDRAARDLDDAYRWYAERASQAAALWYNGFLDTLDSLSTNPERCAVASERRKLSFEIRQLLYGRQHSYRAIFLIREPFFTFATRHTVTLL
jgi:plasmid stabilization system protein ParE